MTGIVFLEILIVDLSPDKRYGTFYCIEYFGRLVMFVLYLERRNLL